jgi:hypothetical protein
MSEKARLLQEMISTVAKLADAVTALQRCPGDRESPEFYKAQQDYGAALMANERAAWMYDRHLKKHGC